jgi:hypothetical protein
MAKENEVKVKEWFDEYDKPREEIGEQLPIFEMKLKDGQLARTENLVFQSEGEKKTTRFGETIIFNVTHDGKEKVWFIKRTQYNLLNPIAKVKKSGLLKGRTAEVQRVGSGAKETKWSIAFK